MFPYIEYPILDLGFYSIGAFPLLVGAAIVLEFQLVLRRAPRVGIALPTASSLVGWAIVLGLLGAHVFDVVVYYPEKLVANPLELFRFWGGVSSVGGMLSGLLALFFAMRRAQMSSVDMTRFVDCVIYALPFTLAVGRAGCALQHDHLGIASDHWLAVQFPAGARFDLGLLEFLYTSLLAGLFVALGRSPRPAGLFTGLFFTLYAPVRFGLDMLRTGDARYLGWTPGQYVAVFGTLVGVAILFRSLQSGRLVSPAEAESARARGGGT